MHPLAFPSGEGGPRGAVNEEDEVCTALTFRNFSPYPRRCFFASPNSPKNYTNFTSLCKSEKVGDIRFFSKILLTRSFPQVKFSYLPSKTLDFALKSNTFAQLPQSFPQTVGKIRKKQIGFCRIYKVHKKVCGKARAGASFFDFCLTLRGICDIIRVRKYIHSERT